MCEEHLYWILVMVFIKLDKYYMRDLMMVPNNFFSNLTFDLYGKLVNRLLYNQAYQQGTARLGEEMIEGAVGTIPGLVQGIERDGPVVDVDG